MSNILFKSKLYLYAEQVWKFESITHENFVNFDVMAYTTGRQIKLIIPSAFLQVFIRFSMHDVSSFVSSNLVTQFKNHIFEIYNI